MKLKWIWNWSEYEIEVNIYNDIHNDKIHSNLESISVSFHHKEWLSTENSTIHDTKFYCSITKMNLHTSRLGSHNVPSKCEFFAPIGVWNDGIKHDLKRGNRWPRALLSSNKKMRPFGFPIIGSSSLTNKTHGVSDCWRLWTPLSGLSWLY